MVAMMAGNYSEPEKVTLKNAVTIEGMRPKNTNN
jgi:hypothetical protein